MPRFGGPGRPPKVKETPVGPSVPIAAPPPPPTESDDGSSTTSEAANSGKGDPSAIAMTNNNNSNNASSNKAGPSSSSDAVVDHCYTAPQWLLQEKQTPKFFSVPIPSVSTEMLQAVQHWIGHHRPPGTSASDNAAAASRHAQLLQTNQALDKVRQLQQDHQTQSKKVWHQKEKLAHALARKQQGMEEFRREKQLELDASLQTLEEQVRAEEFAKFQQQQEAMKLEIQQQFEQQYEAEQQEQSLKRKQVSLSDTDHQDKDNTAGNNTLEAQSIAAASNMGTEEAAETNMEEGEEPEDQEPKPKQVKTESPKKELVSQQIQKKIESCQAKLDSLQEKKSEMVWLLKQVIKADAKRKAELLKLKKAATGPAPGMTPATTTATTSHES